MRQRFLLLPITCLVFLSMVVQAQITSPFDSRQFERNYDSPDDYNRFDYESFLLQSQQSEFLMGQDTLAQIRQQLATTPDELRKLGVEDAVIKELLSLNALQDTLAFISYDLARDRADKGDTLELEQIQAIIQFRKDELLRKALGLPASEIFGQEFFRKNVMELYDEEYSSRRPPENYIIGPGDEITIAMWGTKDLSEKHIISENGEITAPLVGRLYLKGLRFDQARKLIRERYNQIYGSTLEEIEVNLNFSRIIRVNMVGELFNPGTYTFSSTNSVFNALVAMDGPNNLGSLRKIFIKRGGKTIRQMDIYEYLLNPAADEDFFLEENDYIFVPSQGPIVTLAGAVKRPHKYEMLEDEGILDLIEYAAGFEGEASTKSINVRRFQNSEEVLLEISIDSLKQYQTDFPLFNGDSIYVKSIPSSLINYVYVDGAVRVPGQYGLKSGDRISDVLYRAEGPLPGANLEKAYLFRLDDSREKEAIVFDLEKILINRSHIDNVKIQPRDTIYVVSMDSSMQELPISVSGMVYLPGNFNYAKNLTLGDLLFLSGGMRIEARGGMVEVSRMAFFDEKAKNDGKRSVARRFEIGTDNKLPPEAMDYPLLAYDRVVIHSSPDFEVPQSVVLTGEVKYPGEYTLMDKAEKVSSLIKRAGGLTAYAHGAASKLIREEQGPVLLDIQDVLDAPLESRYNYILSDLDTLHVPKLLNTVTLKGYIGYFEVDSLHQIQVPFENGKSAIYYVEKYGSGFMHKGGNTSIYVQQANGEIERVRRFMGFGRHPQVKVGATVIVDSQKQEELRAQRSKERKDKPFDWNRAIDSVAGAAVTVLTVVVLIIQLNNN